MSSIVTPMGITRAKIVFARFMENLYVDVGRFDHPTSVERARAELGHVAHAILHRLAESVEGTLTLVDGYTTPRPGVSYYTFGPTGGGTWTLFF